MKKLGIGHTLGSCYLAYIVQGIVNNFAPLLFVTFVTDYGISLTLIGIMITVNFGVQLLIDLAASFFVDRIGYRPCMVAGHAFAALGLAGLAFLPSVFSVSWVGLYIASGIYAVGGGLIEAIVSPLTEALPFENQKAKMSLLHSFYCWGQLGVILISTLFFTVFGIKNWRILACVWAAIPLVNGIFFLFVPVVRLTEIGEGMPVKKLLCTGRFWLFALLMLCAGSAEISVSQWSSAFAESGLKISKTLGDLFGPCMFALFMGISRVLFSKFGSRMNIRTSLIIASFGCIAGYALCIFSPLPVLALVGCGVVGFFVAVMWPGTLSLSARAMPKGGTAMFALFALAGDAGASLGPTAVGALSDAFGGNISVGLVAGAVFPVIAAVALLCMKTGRDEQKLLNDNNR